MSPKKAAGRDIKFTMLYDAEERDMLEALAAREDRSAAAWVRLAIRRAHAEAFGVKPSKKPKR